MSDFNVPLNRGYVSSRDPAALEQGELTAALATYWGPGDPTRFRKIPGRTAFATGTLPISAVHLLSFDSGPDMLIAKVVSKILQGTPDTPGPLEDFLTGLDAESTILAVAHSNNRWYATNGIDPVIAIEGLFGGASYEEGTEDSSFGATNRKYQSQGFKVPRSGFFSNVQVPLTALGAPTGDVECALYDNTSEEPNVALTDAGFADFSTVGAATLEATSEWATFNLLTPIYLSAETPYHIVLRHLAATSTDAAVWIGDTTGTYTGGIACNAAIGVGWTNRTAVDLNFRVQANRARNAGMIAPTETPAPVASSVTLVAPSRPTAETNTGFLHPEFARDATGVSTKATATVNGGDTAKTCTWKDFASSTAANRLLTITWGYGISGPEGASGRGAPNQDDVIDIRNPAGGKAAVLFEKSENGGVTWATLFVSKGAFTGAYAVPVTANSNLVRFRATITPVAASDEDTIDISDITITSGSVLAPFTTDVGMYYSVAEYDRTRDLESAPGPVSGLVAMLTQNLVTFAYPSVVKNPVSTDWRVYRTFDGGAYPAGATLIKESPITETTFTDNFLIDKDTPGGKTIDFDEVAADNQTEPIHYFRNLPPPRLDHISAFGGGLVGVKGRQMFYTPPGFPEYWPPANVIFDFDLEEHDNLIASFNCGTSQVVFANGAVFYLNDLPRVTQGTLNDSQVSPLRGAPGAVSAKAICSFSVAGESRVAWVSRFGIHQTNTSSHSRLTDDLQWGKDAEGNPGEVNLSTLESSVLSWDREKEILWFEADRDGDGVNDHELPIHMNPQMQKPNGMPMLGQFTPKATSALTQGDVASTYRRFSAHPSDGNVYLEDDGGKDGATDIATRLLVRSPRIYGGRRLFQVNRGSVRHSDWGAGEVCTIRTTLHLDDAQETEIVAETVSLEAVRGSEFFPAGSCEWCQFEIEHTSEALGAIFDLRIEALGMGKAGRV